jgi:hypothetical protein
VASVGRLSSVEVGELQDVEQLGARRGGRGASRRSGSRRSSRLCMARSRTRSPRGLTLVTVARTPRKRVAHETTCD